MSPPVLHLSLVTGGELDVGIGVEDPPDAQVQLELEVLRVVGGAILCGGIAWLVGAVYFNGIALRCLAYGVVSGCVIEFLSQLKGVLVLFQFDS